MALAVLNIDFVVIQAAGRNVILGVPYPREASLNNLAMENAANYI